MTTPSTVPLSPPTMQVWLGAAIALGFFANMAALFFVTVPVANKDVLVTLTSTLVNVFLLLVGYFFGSSAGSAAKTAQIAAAAATPPVVTITSSAMDSAPGAPLTTTITQGSAPASPATIEVKPS